MNKKLLTSAITVCLAGILVIGGIVYAVDKYQARNDSVTIENVEVYNQAPVVSEDVMPLGAFPGSDIYEKVYFFDGIRAESDIHITLETTATSSSETSPVMGEYCHVDADSIEIVDWWFTISNDNGNWAFRPQIGTSSCEAYDSNGACEEYLSAGNSNGTTTATLVAAGDIATSTKGIFTRDAIMSFVYEDKSLGASESATLTPGNWYLLDETLNSASLGIGATSSPFTMETNDCLIISYDVGGATSSGSFDGGNGDFAANFHGITVIK